MQHLQKYERFFNLIKEQTATKTDIPEWFKVFTGEGAKFSKQLGLSNSRDFEWKMVKQLIELKKANFASIKDIQNSLWVMMDQLVGQSKADGKEMKLMEFVNQFRKSKGLGPVSKDKFVDGNYGQQTSMILATAICMSEGVKLSEEEKKEVEKKAIPTVDVTDDVKKDDDNKQVDMEKVSDEGKTGLNPQQLKVKAETIIRDSFVPDETDKSDKFKMGSNKMGARIVYKDKGTNRITEEELAILDEYFGQDGFVRTKSKEKGGILRAKFMKYVWKKVLNPKSKETKPDLEDIRGELKGGKPKEKTAPTEDENKIVSATLNDEIKEKGL
jgi:hypothetical protein